MPLYEPKPPLCWTLTCIKCLVQSIECVFCRREPLALTWAFSLSAARLNIPDWVAKVHNCRFLVSDWLWHFLQYTTLNGLYCGSLACQHAVAIERTCLIVLIISNQKRCIGDFEWKSYAGILCSNYRHINAQINLYLFCTWLVNSTIVFGHELRHVVTRCYFRQEIRRVLAVESKVPLTLL